MAYTGIARGIYIDNSGNSVNAYEGEKINDNDFYISDDDSDGAEGAEHKSIFDMEISDVSPELIRIFNLTPPLNDTVSSAVHASTVVPYYITIYSPIPEGHNSLGIIEGTVPYPELYGRVVSETRQILETYVKRVGWGEWKKKNFKSFDQFVANYFIRKYTHREPFVFHYFLNGEWRIFKYSADMKREIYSGFVAYLRRITEAPNTV